MLNDQMTMLKICFFSLFLSVLVLFLIPAHADVLNVLTDKSVYNNGEKITVSGKVKYNENIPSVIIQILNPAKNNFADIGNVVPKKDGTFSTTFNAGGPTWPSSGIYTVKVSYAGISETTFEFKKITSATEKPSSPPNLQTQNEKPIITKETQETSQEPKTHVPDFPALDKSPQYYIDRYNNEVDYKSWFDSQFPGQTIYNVLGFPNPVAVPNWIKIIAGWWSEGKIGDSDFLDGIEFMIKNSIIVIPDIPESGTSSNQDVPSWIKNSAGWWAAGLIPEDEFVSSLKFLIQQGIIIV